VARLSGRFVDPAALAHEVLLGASGAVGKRYRLVVRGVVTQDARARARLREVLQAELGAVPDGVVSFAAALAENAQVFLPRNSVGPLRWIPVERAVVDAILAGGHPELPSHSNLTLDELQRCVLTFVPEEGKEVILIQSAAADVDDDPRLTAALARLPALRGVTFAPGTARLLGVTWTFTGLGICPCAGVAHQPPARCELDLGQRPVFRCRAPARPGRLALATAAGHKRTAGGGSCASPPPTTVAPSTV
jgi:hypothetical protein